MCVCVCCVCVRVCTRVCVRCGGVIPHLHTLWWWKAVTTCSSTQRVSSTSPQKGQVAGATSMIVVYGELRTATQPSLA